MTYIFSLKYSGTKQFSQFARTNTHICVIGGFRVRKYTVMSKILKYTINLTSEIHIDSCTSVYVLKLKYYHV
jgi:hypothetical protein